jgi:antitoxin (DNA-binding transcriptional repressor) of toxin-antitoxin stability system
MAMAPDRLRLGEARIVTMRELSQRTAQVIGEINEKEEPALVTRHGHFQALILPLANRKVESIVLSRIGNLAETLEEFDPHDSETSAVLTEEAARELE